VWLTAKATRLTYEALKQRIARADGDSATAPRETTPATSGRRVHRRRAKQRTTRAPSTSRRRQRRKTEFVELSAAQLLGAPSAMCTVVEVEDKAGVRMTVRLAREAQIDDVARLVAAFGRRDG
jgi:hypothetical protein